MDSNFWSSVSKGVLSAEPTAAEESTLEFIMILSL